MNEKIKDSGSKQEFSTGAHRDNATGKGRTDLVPLKYVAELMNDNVILEIALFMDDRNYYHLINAIRESVSTVKMFHSENIYEELQNNGISVDTDADNTEEVSLAHMMLEVSKLYEAGAIKYGANNWQFGMPVNRYIDSGVRHYLKTLRGDTDEPHYRGFIWNLLCACWTCENYPEQNFKEEPERDGKN